VPTPIIRVCLLGAESTGKTTLARALAATYETLWNPEYGRPYTEIGRLDDAPWTSWEFTHIARMQCWYEDFLAEHADRVLFCDTDAYTTAIFHRVYLGTETHEFAELTARTYHLYLVCGLDVPWAKDGIREFADVRQTMHDVYLEHAVSSGHPWALVEGDRETRLAAARRAVDGVLRPGRDPDP
jgi:HTH-type transcriptional regulator, transcriptional repressor of NAD biosynthesis genes